ncbi:MAG: ABC transporter substrate-binding protein [Betaproteobacteria bacterium]|nr:ABC transporter substrate-binding protein [Betaproteobacteria bacterium]
MPLRVAIPDMVSPSYFPAIAAVELGFFKKEGLDATIELLFPVTKTYEALRDGIVDFVGGAAHAPLYAFKNWAGCKITCALSQHMYWFLIVRKNLNAKLGDLTALKGLRIGAAPGPVDGLKRMLTAVGIDPERDVKIGPVPGTAGAGVSFGVAAAKALEEGKLDGFWANGMGAEIAIRNGIGTMLLDARRGDGPQGALDYTFAAFVATQARIDKEPEVVAAATRAIIGAQKALKADPSCATKAAQKHFPAFETGLIAELIRRDAPFYDPAISAAKIEALNAFGRNMGILTGATRFEDVVATQFKKLW